MEMRISGLPRKKRGTDSSTDFRRISLIIINERKIPDTKPKESAAASKKLFAMLRQINSAATVMPLQKLM
jgi:hypothetical protein